MSFPDLTSVDSGHHPTSKTVWRYGVVLMVSAPEAETQSECVVEGRIAVQCSVRMPCFVYPSLAGRCREMVCVQLKGL